MNNMDAGIGFDQACGDVLGSMTGANRGVILFYLPFLIIVFGIFGNALNIIVYSHKSLGTSPVNIIFKAQAICDFFLLLNYLYLRSWMVLPSTVGRTTILTVILLIVLMFIRELRLTASWFHILLAHRRYIAIADPLQSRIRTDMQSTRRSVIVIIVGCLIESFIVILVFFLGVFLVPIKFTLVILPICYQLPFVVTFIILSTVSIRFAWGVIKTRNNRENVEISMSRRNGQPMNRMDSAPVNRMVLVMLGVFFMTEIPPVITWFLGIERHKMSSLDAGCLSTLVFFNIFLYIMPSLNTLCYLLMSSQYRRVLRSVFRSKKMIVRNGSTYPFDADGTSGSS